MKIQNRFKLNFWFLFLFCRFINGGKRFWWYPFTIVYLKIEFCFVLHLYLFKSLRCTSHNFHHNNFLLQHHKRTSTRTTLANNNLKRTANIFSPTVTMKCFRIWSQFKIVKLSWVIQNIWRGATLCQKDTDYYVVIWKTSWDWKWD